jgi:hypothetical protein
MERGTRWMEKEEAVSLRTALEDMDLKNHLEKDKEEHVKESVEDEEETRIYNAALDEAAELVWRHEHGVKSPEPGAPYRYKQHMRRNSYAHARTASIGRYGGDIIASGLARDVAPRSVSGSSSGSDGRSSLSNSPRRSVEGPSTMSVDTTNSKSYGSLGGKRVGSGGTNRRSSMKRNISGEVERPFSGDQIWEEPEAIETPKSSKPSAQSSPDIAVRPLRLKQRNSPNRVQFAPDSSSSSEGKGSPTAPTAPAKPPHIVEIHKNPPSQSRNPNYMSNSQKPAGPRANDQVPKKNGIEVRGDDIRQATSFKLADRSGKLLTPSAVSDRPGRPIVSFDTNWKPPEEAAADHSLEPKEKSQREPSRFSVGVQQGRQQHQTPATQPQQLQPSSSQGPPVPSISAAPSVRISPAATSRPPSNTPPIPSVAVDAPNDSNRREVNVPVLALSSADSPAPPSIVVSGDSNNVPAIPVIVTPDDDGDMKGGNAHPNIPVIVTPDDGGKNQGGARPSARPLPTPSSRSPFSPNYRGRQRGHWSPSPGAVTRSTTICHQCTYPIEGRFVSLRGGTERFHPQCFACYTCGTSLEALEISPEPDSFRTARLDRIARREAGEILEEMPGQTIAEDGDTRLRFYCHLDWHELFAPRCKTCTTPIIGEHIVALGQHFHYGHFFCAECGDPFEQGMTHIEKDGYAWCVGCQTKRTERRAPKCRRCRRPVIGQYVQALGGEWHDECFRCGACGGGFEDGQIFPVGDSIRCTDCRMRELKA